MIFPEPLKAGGRVALIAPSSPVISAERLDYACSYAAKLGLAPVVFESCRSRYGHLAGSDELRASDLNRAFKDDSIDGIFCIRGGNGAPKILNKIDFDIVKQNPKFFCGYSDVTALHTALNQSGLATFHTPMAAEPNFEEADPYTLNLLEQFIFDPFSAAEIPLPANHKTEVLKEGEAEGVLCGGNLSCLSSLMGTPFEIGTAGKILFIEEIGTNPARVDRMLNGLCLAGKFEQCAGVIFGDFTNCEPIDPGFSLTIPEILNNLNLKVPAIYNYPCGHILPTASLPFGPIIRMNTAGGALGIKWGEK